MALPMREIFRLPAPVSIIVAEPGLKEDGSITIKGFASVEVPDRSGDMVPPEEFHVEQFMASPTILVNHKYWTDYTGNGVAVGRPLSLNRVKLRKSENPDNWDIVDVDSGEVVSTYPKQKVPNLVAGDRGLFMVAEITQPEVAKMVDRGELSSFSWRGLSTIEYKVDPSTSKTVRLLTDIDLYEISLVNIPDQPNATFMVGKGGVDEAPLVVTSIRLEKSRFETQQQAIEYLKTHKMVIDSIREDGHAFVSLQRPQTEVDVSKLVSVKMCDGVHVVAGPLKTIPSEWFTRPLSADEASRLNALFEKSTGVEVVQQVVEKSVAENMIELFTNTVFTRREAKKEIVMAEETKVDGVTQTEAEKAVGEKCPNCGQVMKGGKCTNEKCSHKTAEEQVELIGQKMAEKTAAALTPLFEKMTGAITTMGEGMTKMAEKMAAFAAPKTETKKTPEPEKKEEVAKGVIDTLNTLAQGILDTQNKLVEVAKSVDGMKSVTPAAIPREEVAPAAGTRTETVKGADSKDKNSCMDSLFPFLG